MERGFWRHLAPWQWVLGLVGLALVAIGYWVGIRGSRPYLLLVLPGVTFLVASLWSSRHRARFPFIQRKKWRLTLFLVGIAILIASFIMGVFNQAWAGWTYFIGLALAVIGNPIWDEVFWDEPTPGTSEREENER